jgi:hypothetical protein
MAMSLRFLEQQEALFQNAKALTPFHADERAAPPDVKERARENLIQALFNRSEFVTIR